MMYSVQNLCWLTCQLTTGKPEQTHNYWNWADRQNIHVPVTWSGIKMSWFTDLRVLLH